MSYLIGLHSKKVVLIQPFSVASESHLTINNSFDKSPEDFMHGTL